MPSTWDELTTNTYWCWTRDASHQDLNVTQALAVSCDVFFYSVGAPAQKDERGTMLHYYQPGDPNPTYFGGLGIDKINQYLNLFGFGARSGVELANEVEGLIPGATCRLKKSDQEPINEVIKEFTAEAGKALELEVIVK